MTPPRHHVSRTAIELIKRFEGYRRKAAQLPDGRWTIGYGHTASARAGAEVSEEDAEALLLYDLMVVARAVDELTYASLTDNQFDALCAFAFSIGPDAFRRSEVLKRVNEGAFTDAAFAMELWRKAEFEGERIVIDALVRRRAAEKLLFLTPPGDAWRPAPSAVLKPELDADAALLAPRHPPVPVAASLEGESVRVTREDADADASPVTAAAEAVAARLQTIFPEPAPEPDEPPAGEGELPELELVDVAPAEEAPAEAPPEPEPEPDAPPSFLARPPLTRERRVMIDDTAPFEFVPPSVQPLTPAADESPLVIAVLLVLGVGFFAGGVFWAMNGHPEPQPRVFTPVLVGWLAGVAGAGFLGAAVFLLLQRLSRAAERRERRRR